MRTLRIVGQSRYEGKLLLAECIHGLDEALCDLCTPKPTPKAEPVPVKASRPRAAAGKSRVAGAAASSVVRGDQRLYHLTHISNLAGILAAGLLADSQHPQPAVDISSADNRDERRRVAVGSASVADFVPFFVSPDSALWQGMRASLPDPRLSPEVRGMAPAEFAVLVTTVDKAAVDTAVVAVGDAADAGTRFAATPESARRELGRMRGDDEVSERAEFLVRDRLPFESVTLIGVANDRARNEVRELLAETEYTTKVSIYPPWFARP